MYEECVNFDVKACCFLRKSEYERLKNSLELGEYDLLCARFDLVIPLSDSDQTYIEFSIPTTLKVEFSESAD